MCTIRELLRFLALATLLLCACRLAPGADLLVPQQFATIQSAVNAASNGDRVLVARTDFPLDEVTITNKFLTLAPQPGSTLFSVRGIFVSGGAATLQGVLVPPPYGFGVSLDGGTSVTLVDCEVHGQRGSDEVHQTGQWACATPGKIALTLTGTSKAWVSRSLLMGGNAGGDDPFYGVCSPTCGGFALRVEPGSVATVDSESQIERGFDYGTWWPHNYCGSEPIDPSGGGTVTITWVSGWAVR